MAVYHRLLGLAAINRGDLDEFEEEFQMDIEDNAQTCCSALPFFLQDLCLLVVINELDSYPTKQLAALPKWLRYRILSSAPALDLARLESTPVASGVDTDGIWKSRLKSSQRGAYGRTRLSALSRFFDVDNHEESSSKGNPFHFDVSGNHRLCSLSQVLRFGYYGIHDSDFTQHLVKDLEVSDSKLSVGNQFLFDLVSDLFTSSNLDDLICQLISIQGNLVLSNLIGASHQDCRNPMRCNQVVWKRQVTALVIKGLDAHSEAYPYHPYLVYGVIQLTPRRLIHFYDQSSPTELLFLIFNSCQLRPFGVNFCIDAVSRSIMPSLCKEMLALDSNLTLPSEDTKYVSIIHCFLENVVSLRLQCDDYGQISVMVNMVKMAIANGQASNLKHLICSMSDLYMDIIGPLCSLFSLQNFQLLLLDVNKSYPLALNHLLQAFITAPCPHVQKLILRVRDSQFHLMLKENQLASLDMKGMTIPSCSLKHKVLIFSSRNGLTNGLYLLLQFPVIRLKKLALLTSSENFHLCAAHPDLQIIKLEITVDLNMTYTSYSRQNPSQKKITLQEDIMSLFQIDSLRKIRISGVDIRESNEVILGLVQGLQGRSHLTPLKKLSLELETHQSYEIQDLEALYDAIFSLPELQNLKLILGGGFGDMTRDDHYEEAFYKSWNHKSAGIKLKSILLKTHETDLKQVSLTTEHLSFSLPKLPDRVSPEYTMYSGYDYDDIYGGSDDSYSYGYDPWTYDSDDY
jgi:hypothetical protein